MLRCVLNSDRESLFHTINFCASLRRLGTSKGPNHLRERAVQGLLKGNICIEVASGMRVEHCLHIDSASMWTTDHFEGNMTAPHLQCKCRAFSK